MNNTITLNGEMYARSDFQPHKLLQNDALISALEMKTLPNTFLSILGISGVDTYKPILKRKVELYDTSLEINSFVYNGNLYWLDKQQRACMKTLADSGLDFIEVILPTGSVMLETAKLKQFLTELEIYAYKCYVNTAKHLNAIESLTQIEEILNYDYTTGYPEKITLE
jgi:hypothetical protein